MGRAPYCTEMAKAGSSQRKIAQYLGRTKTIVFNALNDRKKSESTGHPRKTTAKDDCVIMRASKKDPFKALKKIRVELNLAVSSLTVQRRLVERGLGGKSFRKFPMLTPKHLKARMMFALNHFDVIGPEKEKQWRNILRSDETKVTSSARTEKLGFIAQ
ncbi:uncharacterized protein LOC129741294 [Uranotaenia lowii]|uniref:uncharacterized protein LOC129741294 n=1 Tax=Uranotaenia lowii TaxID=190385 RepID=UPI00247905FB|nr:uncharacterized protein LOC129741294 [Uranotaenia lowii]